MPAIEFTYIDAAGNEFECCAEYDPPDQETGLTAPRIDSMTIKLESVSDEMLSKLVEFAMDRLLERPTD